MIKYINNNRPKTILFLHGLACNSSYYEDIVNLLNFKYNFLLVDLFGHYPNSKKQFTIEDEVESILKYCVYNSIKIDLIVAHSMSSIIAFYLDKAIESITILILLEGNIIPEDFEWSSKISSIKEKMFSVYWKKFQKQYSLLLKIKLKNKVDIEKYTNHIYKLDGFGIYCYSKIISKYQNTMDIFNNSFSKILYIESDKSTLVIDKKKLAAKYDFKLLTISNSSHYMLIDNSKEIVDIIMGEVVCQ